MKNHFLQNSKIMSKNGLFGYLVNLLFVFKAI